MNLLEYLIYLRQEARTFSDVRQTLTPLLNVAGVFLLFLSHTVNLGFKLLPKNIYWNRLTSTNYNLILTF